MKLAIRKLKVEIQTLKKLGYSESHTVQVRIKDYQEAVKVLEETLK